MNCKVLTKFNVNDLEVGDLIYDGEKDAISKIVYINPKVREVFWGVKPNESSFVPYETIRWLNQIALENTSDGMMYIVDIRGDMPELHCGRKRFRHLVKPDTNKVEVTYINQPIISDRRDYTGYPCYTGDTINTTHTSSVKQPIKGSMTTSQTSLLSEKTKENDSVAPNKAILDMLSFIDEIINDDVADESENEVKDKPKINDSADYENYEAWFDQFFSGKVK